MTTLRQATQQALEQPEQEPVAWMYTSKLAGNQQYITLFQHDLTIYKADKVWPLYTTTPAAQPTAEDIAQDWDLLKETQAALRDAWAILKTRELVESDPDSAANAAAQRPWVGLTDEEISATSKGHIVRSTYARAIESKLKEKNT
jgi:hypothetical protein